MLRQRRSKNKPITLETRPGKPMIHTPKPTTLDGGMTQNLGGETNKIKTKIRDVTTPTTMQLTNIPHRDHINTTLTTPLHIHTKTRITKLTPPLSTHPHLKIDSPKLRLCLKAYAKRFKITRFSKRRCELISKTRETPLRG